MGGRTGRRPMTVEIRQHGVACLACGAQWWIDERGYEMPGPPLFRYKLVKVPGTPKEIRVRALETREPTQPCQCAQESRVVDGPSQLVEHNIVPTYPSRPSALNGRGPDPATMCPPPVTELSLCVDGRDVGRLDLEHGELTQAIVERATNYRPVSASVARKERRLAEHRLRGLDRVGPVLADWLMDVACWEADVEKLASQGSGDPTPFLAFLERHPDGINLLAVPAVQRAIHWIRLECKKPVKERLGRWLGGTMNDHRPARLDPVAVGRIYRRFQEDLMWSLRFIQRCRHRGDSDDQAWQALAKRCRGVWYRVDTAGLRQRFLQCAEHPGKGGGRHVNYLAYRLVAQETGVTPDYVRRLVKREIKGAK